MLSRLSCCFGTGSSPRRRAKPCAGRVKRSCVARTWGVFAERVSRAMGTCGWKSLMADLAYWQTDSAALYHADAREIPLPDGSVHMCVTSPPYWGLRDYGLAGWQGGDAKCGHTIRNPNTPRQTISGSTKVHDVGLQVFAGTCGRCGAVQESTGIGAEPTLGEHIENLVAVFREVRRVLRNDGTAWLNYGDAYAGGGRGTNPHGKQGTNRGTFGLQRESGSDLSSKNLMGLPWRVGFALQADGWIVRSAIPWVKPNPMPESVRDRPTSAYEMVFMLSKSNAATYWVHRDLPGTRSEPEPDYRWIDAAASAEYDTEPERYSDMLIECPDCGGSGVIVKEAGQASLFDGAPTLTSFCTRCSTCGRCEERDEHVGQVHRWRRVNLWRAHDYYYDAEALRTKWTEASVQRLSQSTFETQTGGPKDSKSGNRSHRKVLENLKRRQPSGVAPRERRTDKQRGHSRTHAGFNDRWDGMSKAEQQADGANARNVWVIPTQGRPDAHFATFPDELPRRCIVAGTSEHGVCSECGAPWERVVHRSEAPHDGTTETMYEGGSNANRLAKLRQGARIRGGEYKDQRATMGWRPTCDHDADIEPALVLDPFVGSGTAVAVAQSLGRRGVGLDLSPEYLEIAAKRIGKGVSGG